MPRGWSPSSLSLPGLIFPLYLYLKADPAFTALAAYSRAGMPLDYSVPSLPSLKALEPRSKPLHLHPALLVTSTLLPVWQGRLRGSRRWERCVFEPFGLGFCGLRRSYYFVQVMWQGKQPWGCVFPSLRSKSLAW